MRVLCAAGALIAVLVCAPAAHANLPASISMSLGPGAFGTVSSPPLPPTLPTIAIDVQPEAKADLAPSTVDIVRRMTMILGSQPPGARILTCVFMYRALESDPKTGKVDIETGPDPLNQLFLNACLEIASNVRQQQMASAAAAGCKQLATQVRSRVKRGGGGYTLTASAPVKKAKARKLPVRVSCKPKGVGYSLRVSTRSKKKSLRSVVGNQLSLGVKVPADASGSARLKFTFRK